MSRTRVEAGPGGAAGRQELEFLRLELGLEIQLIRGPPRNDQRIGYGPDIFIVLHDQVRVPTDLIFNVVGGEMEILRQGQQRQVYGPSRKTPVAEIIMADKIVVIHDDILGAGVIKNPLYLARDQTSHFA